MTPVELKEARQRLGLSTAGLARTLKLGKAGARTVRRWESGDSQIPGPAQVAIMLIETAPEIRQQALADAVLIVEGLRIRSDATKAVVMALKSI